MVENYSQRIDHTTLDPGIYLRASHGGVFTWDLRLVAPRDNSHLIGSSAIHSLEHLLAKHLRDALDDNYIGVFPMGCKTGMTILTKENQAMYDNFQGILLQTLSNIHDKADYVPFSSEKECGNSKCHNLKEAKDSIEHFLSGLLRKFLFLCPLQCEQRSLRVALEKYFGNLAHRSYVFLTGIGKANVAHSLGLNLFKQSYVVLTGFAGTNYPNLHQGDVVFPTYSQYGDVYDEFGILSDIKETNKLTGKDYIVISTNDSFASKSFLKRNGIKGHYVFDMEANALASVLKAHYPDRGVKLIVSRMISDNISSASQGEDFNTFKDKQDFSPLLIGSLQLTEYFSRIEYK